METVRQESGANGTRKVKAHCPCMNSGFQKWKAVKRELDGIGLQCGNCRRFAQCKSDRLSGNVIARAISLVLRPAQPMATRHQ